MIDYSLNELASRAKLSARGAGYSWGMAEEVSRAVYWLAHHNLPHCSMLLPLLNQIDSSVNIMDTLPKALGENYYAQGEYLCPIAAGCALSDSFDIKARESKVLMTDVLSPELLLPFVADIAQRCETIIVLEFNNENLATDGVHIKTSSSNLYEVEKASTLLCRVAGAGEVEFTGLHVPERKTRAVVSEDVWKALGVYAHNTYAPASERSRELGAGAGLNDND